MRKGISKYLLPGVIFGLLALLVMAMPQAAMAGDGAAIVANAKVADTALTVQEVRDLYLGKKTTWNSGTTVVLATLAGGEVHESFMTDVVGKTASQFGIFWKKKAFSGKGVEPRSFASEEELLKFVAATEGAIGYVSAKTAANADASKGCKIISTK